MTNNRPEIGLIAFENDLETLSETVNASVGNDALAAEIIACPNESDASPLVLTGADAVVVGARIESEADGRRLTTLLQSLKQSRSRERLKALLGVVLWGKRAADFAPHTTQSNVFLASSPQDEMFLRQNFRNRLLQTLPQIDHLAALDRYELLAHFVGQSNNTAQSSFNDVLTAAMGGVQKELLTARKRGNDLESYIEDLTDELRSWNFKHEELQNAETLLRENHVEFVTRLHETFGENAIEITDLTANDLTAWAGFLKAERERGANLAQQLAETEIVRDNLHNERTDLLQQLEYLRQNLSDNTQKFETREAELQHSLTETEAQLVTTTADRDDLLQKLGQTIVERDELAVQFEQTGKELTSVLQILAQTQTERDDFIGKYDQTKTERDDLTVKFGQTIVERDTFAASLQIIETERDKLDANLKNLTAEHETLTANFEETRIERDDLAVKIEKAHVERDEMRLKSEKADAEREIADARFKHSEIEREEFAAGLEKARAEIAELAAYIEESQPIREELETKILLANGERDEMQMQIGVLSHRRAELERELNALREADNNAKLSAEQKSAALQTENEELKNQNQNLQTQIAHSQTQIETAASGSDEFSRQIVEKEKQISALQTEFDNAGQTASEEIARLNAALEAANTEAVENAKRIELAAAENASQLEIVAQMQQRIEELKQNRAVIQPVIQTASVETASAQQKQSHLSALVKETPANEPTDVRELLDSVCAMVKPYLDGKPVQIHCEISERVGFVQIERNKLRQILFNLLTNSAKYTVSGQIIAQVDYTPENVLSFSVIDSGSGIDERKLQTIFDDASDVMQSNRSLPATRRLAESLGGRIQAKSRLGVGSMFSVALPIPVAAVEDELLEISL